MSLVFSLRRCAFSSPGASALLEMTIAISACSRPARTDSAMASKLEPRPESRMPSFFNGGTFICIISDKESGTCRVSNGPGRHEYSTGDSGGSLGTRAARGPGSRGRQDDHFCRYLQETLHEH